MKYKHTQRRAISRLAYVVIAFCFVVLIIALLSGCSRSANANKDAGPNSSTLSYIATHVDYAYISLPNGEIAEGMVTRWHHGSHNGEVQIEIDGTIYTTHISNATLITK